MKFSATLEMTDPYPEILRSAISAEEFGYDLVWIPDERFQKDPYAIMTACALNTKRIRLGLGVTNPYTRSPASTARAMATCGEISEGRVILGLGAGSPKLASQFGVHLEKPAQLLKRTTLAIRKLFDGGEVTCQNSCFTLKNVRLDFDVRNMIPIYIGGRGSRILEVGGEVGDGVIAGAGLATPDGMRYAVEHITKGSTRVGRDPSKLDIVCWAFTSIAEDVEQAKDCIRPTIALILATTPRHVLENIGVPIEVISAIREVTAKGIDILKSFETLRELIDDRTMNQFSIVGSVEQCIRRVKELEQVGVKHIGIVPFPNASLSTSETISLFARDIISAL